MAWSLPPGLLAMELSGDIGDVTYYLNRNLKTVAFPKDWRQEKTSPSRLRQRARFRAAQLQWMSLESSEKTVLEEACRILSMPLTGQNLYVSVGLTGNIASYETVADQSGLTLPPAPLYVP